MYIQYSFHSEKGPLPNATTLFETVRRLHQEFIENPVLFARKYEEWLRPMNQLKTGHFFSINWNARNFPFTEYYNNNSELRLEMIRIADNFMRINFETKKIFPYRITVEKVKISPRKKSDRYKHRYLTQYLNNSQGMKKTKRRWLSTEKEKL